MGCLNYGQFNYWFGNIHLSGPCNRACYFCIGQHMMALDPLNNLKEWPIKGLDTFVERCKARGVSEVNVTGSNTDPLLFTHTNELKEYLLKHIPNLRFGLRTNGALALAKPEIVQLYDKLSVTVCSFDPVIYKQMMGKGEPPDIKEIIKIVGERPLKINLVLGPENSKTDVFDTLRMAAELGIKKVNLREPYGQSHIGNPFGDSSPFKYVYGNPCYVYHGVEVVYWDVHYTHVESVNLYATGRVSEEYPISLGHDEKTGKVLPQSEWNHGRITNQWQYSRKVS